MNHACCSIFILDLGKREYVLPVPVFSLFSRLFRILTTLMSWCFMIIQALDLFQEGLDIAHENVLRCLELMWMRFIDDASHYNHITGTARLCTQFDVLTGESPTFSICLADATYSHFPLTSLTPFLQWVVRYQAMTTKVAMENHPVSRLPVPVAASDMASSCTDTNI